MEGEDPGAAQVAGHEWVRSATECEEGVAQVMVWKCISAGELAKARVIARNAAMV